MRPLFVPRAVGAAKHVGLVLHQERVDLLGFRAKALRLREEVEECAKGGILISGQQGTEALGVMLE